MNLRQLQSLCEIVDRGLRITDAADVTNRSQTSVTRQIQQLERELGFELFLRRRNKILGVTPQGQEIVTIARRILQETKNMRRIADNLQNDDAGDFTIATTHTQARYIMPQVIKRFIEKYPRVRLSLRQGTPKECCELVALGKSDLAFCSDPREVPDELVEIPCYNSQRCVVTPLRHPLTRVKPLTLEALAQYPLITYHEGFSSRRVVDRAFSDKGLSPRVVLQAADIDVSKVYVAMGLGIAIFSKVAYDPATDVNLHRIDASHLFKPTRLNLLVRRHSHLRSYMHDFVHMFAPKLTRAVIEEAVFTRNKGISFFGALPDLDA